MKNKGRFWRAKASLFGRESVAAFLVGDLGCALQGSQTAPIFHWLQPAPPSTPFRFETRVCPACCRFHKQLSQSSKVVQTCQQPPSKSLLVTRHSSLVTRHSSPGIVTTGNPLRHFLAPCSPRHTGHISFLLVWSMPSGRGPAGEGPTLIIVGKGEESTPDMMHRPLPI